MSAAQAIHSAMASNEPVNERWTDERVAELKRLWREGQSAAQIAAHFGDGFTRNAVIGKIARLKLPARRTSGIDTMHAGQRAAKAHGNRGQPKANAIVAKKLRLQQQPSFRADPLPEEELGNDVTNLLGLMELTSTTCRWPIGDPLLPGFGFCGRHSMDGSPYCEDHHKRGTYRP